MYIVIDTETTGLEDDAKIVEIAGILTTAKEIKKHKSHLCNPGVDIPAEASAIHHLTKDDVEGHPPFEVIAGEYNIPKVVFVAHNAAYDKKLTRFEGKWICTYKCSYVTWPDAPSHSNQVLRYWLGLNVPEWALGVMPHRALHDAAVTCVLFHELCKNMSIEQMLDVSNKPLLLQKFNFGKHKGEPIDRIPRDYLEWCLKQPDMKEEVIYTCKHHLGIK
jgi:exodeoxyribonuclease X